MRVTKLEHQALDNSVRSALQGLVGQVWVSIFCVNSGMRVDINSTTQLPAASVIKLAVVTELMFRIETGSLRFTDSINIVRGSSLVPSPESSSGVLCLIDSPISLTVGELAALTLVVSDNIAADLLIDRLGMDQINNRMKSLGLSATTVNTKFREPELLSHDGINPTTAHDMVALLLCIYNQQVPFSGFITSLLRQQRFRHGIPYLLPNEAIVLNKTGTIYDEAGTITVNDAGIILGDNPVIISFLSTAQASFSAASLAIASVARLLYWNHPN